LERRGHRFARYADDANVYVRSIRAGQRVMVLLRRCYAKLHLVVNEGKSAVASVFGRKFLGYGLWVARGGEVKRKVAEKPLTSNSRRWWRNSDRLLKTVMTTGYFDRLGVPRLS